MADTPRMNASALHRRRLEAERRFVWYGRAALATALLMLFVLLATLFWRGAQGFMELEVRVPVEFSAQSLGLEEGQKPEDAPVSAFIMLAKNALSTRFAESDPDAERELSQLLGGGAGITLRNRLLEHPEWMGTTRPVWLPASHLLAQGYRSGLDEDALDGGLSEQQLAFAKSLDNENALRAGFNTRFFTEGDSRQPERAGFLGAIVGSLLTVAACLLVAFPLGVMTAVYLEEFAKPGLLVDIVEVNINNLAAVPSIVFGLLGLAVYLGVFGMPRSAPLVGGFTLAMMILPVIIITTRYALRAVPNSIRDAARALGASPLQVVWHHTLPLALPGIMTGTILGIARALGETAPLLMIGMVAFVADIPGGFTDPATVMPVQIFLWASSPETAFVQKTSAGILVLLAVLLVLNALAIYIRRRFETRW